MLGPPCLAQSVARHSRNLTRSDAYQPLDPSMDVVRIQLQTHDWLFVGLRRLFALSKYILMLLLVARVRGRFTPSPAPLGWVGPSPKARPQQEANVLGPVLGEGPLFTPLGICMLMFCPAAAPSPSMAPAGARPGPLCEQRIPPPDTMASSQSPVGEGV